MIIRVPTQQLQSNKKASVKVKVSMKNGGDGKKKVKQDYGFSSKRKV